MMRSNLSSSVFLLLSASGCLSSPVTLVEHGEPRAAIYVEDQVMQTEDTTRAAPHQRLRASVEDLAHYLAKISGAEIEILTHEPNRDDERVPILIGALAIDRFGPPKTNAPAGQGFRVVVTPEAIGLMDESDLGASYAVYEVLDQLGCRWYMPSEMGQVIPRAKTIALREQDLDSAPYTYYRGVWAADADYRRRNRHGGLSLESNHALEDYISMQLLEQHPEWRAVGVDGKHHKDIGGSSRLKWSQPGVAEAIADEIIHRLDERPQRQSVSLSPGDGPADGTDLDTTDDRSLDVGDWNPATQDNSHTDRLVWLCNRIAEQVTEKYPNVRFGMLAYHSHSRPPPVREKLHPNLVPQIAPLAYARGHPMTDPGEPNNESLRHIVRGWAKASDNVSYYYYGYFWPELSMPHPLITKWCVDLPIIYEQGNCRYWHPETLPNVETTIHALHLGNRMAWNPRQDPKAIIDELHAKFYGHAADEMAEYWHFIDQCWVDTPDYSQLGFLRRFPADRMNKARRLMKAALHAVQTPEEMFRVGMANDSLELFALYMKMRLDLAEGRFVNLARDAMRWRAQVVSLADKYEPQYAFGRVRRWTGGDSAYGVLFARLHEKIYKDAARIATDYLILTTPPLRDFRYQIDEDRNGEAAGWADPNLDDCNWKTTDPSVDTWSSMGLHNYRAAMWYRTRILLPEIPKGKKVYLWIGATYGRAKVFVNGRHVPDGTDSSERSVELGGKSEPVSFDITGTVRAGTDNQIAIFCVRKKGHGLGGLVAPVVIYQERP